MRMYPWSLYSNYNNRSCILTYHGEWGFGSALPLIPVPQDAGSHPKIAAIETSSYRRGEPLQEAESPFLIDLYKILGCSYLLQTVSKPI